MSEIIVLLSLFKLSKNRSLKSYTNFSNKKGIPLHSLYEAAINNLDTKSNMRSKTKGQVLLTGIDTKLLHKMYAVGSWLSLGSRKCALTLGKLVVVYHVSKGDKNIPFPLIQKVHFISSFMILKISQQTRNV